MGDVVRYWLSDTDWQYRLILEDHGKLYFTGYWFKKRGLDSGGCSIVPYRDVGRKIEKVYADVVLDLLRFYEEGEELPNLLNKLKIFKLELG